MLIPIVKTITTKRLNQLLNGRNKKAYREWREYVLKRDNYTCQYPGCNRKEKIEVHHIRKFASAKHLRFITGNAVCLCSIHHDHIFNKEYMFEELFFRIAVKNEREYKNRSDKQ